MTDDSKGFDKHADGPALSVVVPALEGYRIIRTTVEHLHRQSIAGRIELLIMARQPERVIVPREVRGSFHSVRITGIDENRSMGFIRAEGIRQARAPFVAISGDHSFTNTSWAEKVLNHHQSCHTPAGDKEPVATRPAEDPVRIGVIGCGRLAREVHLPLLARSASATVVSLADPVERAREESSRYAPGARLCEDPREILGDDRVEAIVICTPSGHHAELAIAALREGKHVYLEKPIATTVDAARDVVEAWREAGTVGMTGFNYRQHPGYIALRNAIVEGALGKIVSLRATFCTAKGQFEGWRQRRVDGGGVLLDLASHEIDLAHYVLGEPFAEVSARLDSRDAEDDTAHLEARTASGVVMQGFFSSAAVDEAGMEVYGERGKMTVDRYGGLVVEHRGTAAPGPLSKTLHAAKQWRGLGYHLRRARSPWREPSFRAGLERFVAAVRMGENVSPDLEDGLRSLTVIAAAEESAKSGRPQPVRFPEIGHATARKPTVIPAEI